MAARLNLRTGGWEVDRRNAATLLRRAVDKAARDNDSTRQYAYLMALLDVEQELRSRAATEIELSVDMRLLHLRNPATTAHREAA